MVGKRPSLTGWPGGICPASLLAVFGALSILGGAWAQAPSPAGPRVDGMFATSDRCYACHNTLATPNGADVSIAPDWSSSMMAHAALDPYWQAAVRRELVEHPEARVAIEDKCSTCHMPMARTSSRAAGRAGTLFSHLDPTAAPTQAAATASALDGVSCTACHQVEPEGLGEPESFTGGFVVGPPGAPRKVFGPWDVDAGRVRVMHSATAFEPVRGGHLSTSDFCATCHTLYTHALGDDGTVVGELPEQVPYLEWLHSDFAREGQSCQSCHMPVVEEPTAISSVVGVAREGLSRHVFRGGNFFLPRIFQRFGAELGVTAPPERLELMAARTREHLASSSARVALEALESDSNRLVVKVVVENLAGHKLPSAYPSRRAWLRTVVRDAAGRVLFESGAWRPDGSIVGNDNDLDPSRYEPHYEEITAAEQVQIYEAILAGPDGRVTTGLLTAVDYPKDNRLLPRGFARGGADGDIAVKGAATADANFVGGSDQILYRVSLPAEPVSWPLTVETELWYQPIAFRWAMNLDDYDTFETKRFVRYYRELAEHSAIVLTRAESMVPGPRQ